MRRTPFKATVVVSNLPDDFTSSELAALFDEYGLVLGAMIKRSEGGAARGLVNLAPKKSVDAAISALDDMVLRSRHLRVRKAPEEEPRPAKSRARPRTPPPAEAPPATMEAPARPAPRRSFTVERRTLRGQARNS